MSSRVTASVILSEAKDLLAAKQILRFAENDRVAVTAASIMILEIADIRIPPGRNAEFDAAIKLGVETVIARAEGYCLHRVVKGVESPERYLLMIWWQTLEDHTVKFRGGPLFAQWRAIVRPFFAVPPSVEHFSLVTASFGVPS